MSLEEFDYDDKDHQKEKEADQFAIKWTMSNKEFEYFLQSCFNINRASIIDYASHINTHPSIIAGRLAHHEIMSHQKVAAMKLFPQLKFK